jgi:hypothetical protein
MNFNIIDNLGVPMFQVDYSNPYLWVGNLGSTVDIRTYTGSLGSPLIVHGMDDDGRIMDMSIQEYIKYVEYLERSIKRQLVLDSLVND